MRTMIDPPEGWKYGFPKTIPEELERSQAAFNKWLTENGYPQWLIDEFDGEVPCRMWMMSE